MTTPVKPKGGFGDIVEEDSMADLGTMPTMDNKNWSPAAFLAASFNMVSDDYCPSSQFTPEKTLSISRAR